jgi:5-formyltetrahydrofolate cyclo-ligase
MPAAPVTQKSAMRVAALTCRDAIPAETRGAAAASVAARDFPIAVARGAVVAGYAPMRSEFDPRPLMLRLAAEGATLALPVVTGRDVPLTFRTWVPGDALVTAAFGMQEPSGEAEPLVPDILLVPLAAFDRAGHRIGYGAGYYDRTLTALRSRKSIIAIGLAFAAQETEKIAADSHDAPLDLILTEAGVVDFRGA